MYIRCIHNSLKYELCFLILRSAVSSVSHVSQPSQLETMSPGHPSWKQCLHHRCGQFFFVEAHGTGRLCGSPQECLTGRFQESLGHYLVLTILFSRFSYSGVNSLTAYAPKRQLCWQCLLKLSSFWSHGLATCNLMGHAVMM